MSADTLHHTYHVRRRMNWLFPDSSAWLSCQDHAPTVSKRGAALDRFSLVHDTDRFEIRDIHLPVTNAVRTNQ